MGKLADGAKQEVKSKAKQIAKKAIKKVISIVLPWILIASIFLVLLGTIKDEMVALLAAAQTRVSSFWTWITNDYWIKLDEERVFSSDGDTEEADETYTIVEKYIKNLADQGISIKELRLLGDYELSEEDQNLSEKELLGKIIRNEDGAYDEPKATIEKYIAEFIRADLITQSIHRGRGTQVIATDQYGNENINWIDGGVYLYRAKNTNSSIAEEEIEDGMVETTLDEIKYVKMEYVSPEKFQEYKDEKNEKIKYKYTLDPDTGELIYAQVKTTVTFEEDVSNTINQWFADLEQWIYDKTGINGFANDVEVEIEEVRVDYKQYISKYTMPYEFLINLCMVTQNPEFVYHVALLARDTKIVLAIHDDETIEEVTTETERELANYKNYSDDTVAGATETTRTVKMRKTTITTTTNASNLMTRYANAWSFYEEFEYTNKVESKAEVSGPTTILGSRPSKLTNYKEATEDVIDDSIGVVVEYGDLAHWYMNDVEKKRVVSTQTITTTNTYTIPEKPKNSVEKSKQFLGLLRNETGECPYDCYKAQDDKKWNYAKQCAREAVFDRDGINVAYKIPGMEREEMPLNKLQSGLQILYELLGGENNVSESEESGEYIVSNAQLENGSVAANKDVTDQGEAVDMYNQRMQKLVEHLQYLMTFPENEQYEVINDELVFVPSEDIEDDGSIVDVEDIIVKTDESGAAPEVSKEQLITIIKSAYAGKKETNALSLVDTLIDGQEDNNVNPIFMLAIALQETQIGTVNTEHVTKENNWTSYNLNKIYDSAIQNMTTTINAIANGSYYFTQGKYTIREIGYAYCPNTDDYPTQGDNWVIKVTSTVKYLYSLIGKNVTDDTIGYDMIYRASNGREYKIYRQNNYPNTRYGESGGTIASKGCGLTTDAIILSGYGSNKDPEELLNGRNIISIDGELRNNGVSATRITTGDFKSKIIQALKEGRPAIVHVNSNSSYTRNEHWMPILDIKEENGETQVYVANPNKNGREGWDTIEHLLKGCTEIIIIDE